MAISRQLSFLAGTTTQVPCQYEPDVGLMIQVLEFKYINTLFMISGGHRWNSWSVERPTLAWGTAK
jgi:hypothetical protein